MKPQEIIMKCVFGSHLYGTNTVNSDSDYKGIFMPDVNSIILGRVPKSIGMCTKKGDGKNTPDDSDTELYSLHYFIYLACEGETAALDMLHVPDNMLLLSSDIWDEIVANRHRFYTKNLKAFVGYARRQASKYGIKGSRLNDSKHVLDVLSMAPDNYKLRDIWDDLPTGEHIIKYPATELSNNQRTYEVCGRKVQESVSIPYARSVVSSFYNSYGKRAEQAANNNGIDWKAVSHAIRAAIQVKQILEEDTIIFPLKDAQFLTDIKQGKLNYVKEVAPKLESLMDEVELLASKSTLPDRVDRAYWDEFILSKMKGMIYHDDK